MFNFYLDLAGHDMVTEASRTTTCMRKIKPHDYEQKVQKMKDLSKTWVFKGKQFEDFRQKKGQKQYSQPFKKSQWDTRTLKPSIEQRPCKQQELN